MLGEKNQRLRLNRFELSVARTHDVAMCVLLSDVLGGQHVMLCLIGAPSHSNNTSFY
jgi:hypothetical protein